MLECGFNGLGVGVGGWGVAVGPTGVAVGTIAVGVGVFVKAGVGVFVGCFPPASAGETITAITKHSPRAINKTGKIRFIVKHSPYDLTNL